MANRYWVGDGGNWSSTAHWSATSGGAGGQSVPTSVDDVHFDANSFTIVAQTVVFDISLPSSNATIKSINWTGALHAPAWQLGYSSGAQQITITGDATFITGMTINGDALGHGLIVFYMLTGTTRTLTTGGCVMPDIETDGSVAVNPGTLLLADNVTIYTTGGGGNGNFQVLTGNLDGQGFTITATNGSFNVSSSSDFNRTCTAANVIVSSKFFNAGNAAFTTNTYSLDTVTVTVTGTVAPGINRVTISGSTALGALAPFIAHASTNGGGNTGYIFAPPNSFVQNTFLVAIGTDGSVEVLNVGKDDDGTPIYFELETQEIEFGNRAHLKKIANQMAVFTQFGISASIEAKTDIQEDYQPVDMTLENRVNIGESINLEGHYITFRWFGSSDKVSPIFEGFYIENITDMGMTYG